MLEIHGMKTKPDCATVPVAGDEACLWSWFSSVQAATHDEYGDLFAMPLFTVDLDEEIKTRRPRS
jgi:hypothetical protein